MQIIRTKVIDAFREVLNTSTTQYIAITGPVWVGKSTFLSLLKENGVFPDDTTEWISLEQWDTLEGYTLVNSTPSYIIIDSDISLDTTDIRTFIVSHLLDSKVIFTQEKEGDEIDITHFPLPGISFREYSESSGFPINVGAIMSGTSDINKLNSLKDAYIHLWQFGVNIENPEHIQTSFDEKMSEMVQELFKKEETDFLEFVRTVAMNTGDLFKEERIAKLMNISRRKVRKYSEIILKHNLVHAIGPFVENVSTELSRHVKLYFNDLSYLYAALSVTYYQGMTKQWVLENFLLLELERKLAKTHDIRFYRKKSGAEMQFLIIEKTSGKITSIEVRTGNNTAISQAMKSFDESYHDRVEHYMILTESEAEQKNLNGKNVIILPHAAI